MKLLNVLLVFLSRSRAATVGSLYSLRPPARIYLRSKPEEQGGHRCYWAEVPDQSRATFFVLKVQINKPLWEQWVQVLFCNSLDDQIIGWLTYSEFCRVILPSTWEDENE